jgi:hypothetical protein
MIDPTDDVREEERTTRSLYIFPLIVFDGLIYRDRRQTVLYKPSGACVFGNVGGGVPRRQFIFINHHNASRVERRED